MALLCSSLQELMSLSLLLAESAAGGSGVALGFSDIILSSLCLSISAQVFGGMERWGGSS